MHKSTRKNMNEIMLVFQLVTWDSLLFCLPSPIEIRSIHQMIDCIPIQALYEHAHHIPIHFRTFLHFNMFVNCFEFSFKSQQSANSLRPVPVTHDLLFVTFVYMYFLLICTGRLQFSIFCPQFFPI